MRKRPTFLVPWILSALLWIAATPAAMADCNARPAIGTADSVAGELDSDDCTIFELGLDADDFSFVDLYEITLSERGTLFVDMQSSELDAFVGITDSAITSVIDVDDDGGDGTNARLGTNLMPGTYVILANSFAVEMGSYTLSTRFISSARGDFDADQNADVLLRQTINGSWRLFKLEDFNVASNNALSIFTSNIWTQQTNADFDGDGDVDVLIRRNDGVWRIFEIEDGASVGSNQILLFQNLTWEFQAAVDFDNDGDADILARKAGTGDWRIFEIENRQVVDSAGVGLYTNPLWTFQGVADYDGDGDGDILLRRSDKGWWRIFQINNGALVSSAPAGALFIGSNWKFVSSGDMDKDGVAEIVLRNTATGAWRIFRMIDRTVVGVQNLNLYANLLWAHAQTADFDADGDQDLLLRKSDSSGWRLFNIENRRSISNSAASLWQNANFEVQDISPR